MAFLHNPTSLVPSGSFQQDPYKESEALYGGFDDLTMKSIRTTVESGLSEQTWDDDLQAMTFIGSNSECPTGVGMPGIDPQQLMIEDEQFRQLLRDNDLDYAGSEELWRNPAQYWDPRELLEIIFDNDKFGEIASLLLSPKTSQEPNNFAAGDSPGHRTSLTGIHPSLTSSSRTGRGHRSPNWTPEEKDAYLKVRVEGLRSVKGKDWDFISETLDTGYNIKRTPKSCEDLWGTLVKSYKRIRDHESMCRNSVGQNSYFMMEEEERIAHKLPKSFPLEWCKMMERILKARGKLKCEESCSPMQDVPGYHHPKDGSTDLSDLEPCLQSYLQENGSKNAKIDLLNSNSTSTAKIQLKSYLQSLFMDALQPIASLLQCQQKEEEEYEAKLQTIAKKRRALDLEEMQLKRQRAGHHLRTRSKCRTK